ncbi:MAG: hypothetical protein ACK5L5_03245 [Bacteroidales bacterium]
MKNESRNNRKGGRPSANDPAKNCVMVRFTDTEYAQFLSMYDKSGVYAKPFHLQNPKPRASFDPSWQRIISILSSYLNTHTILLFQHV